MSKKVIIGGIVVVSIAVIVGILINNKKTAEAKAAAGADTDKAVTVSVTAVGKDKLTESLTIVGVIAASNDVSIISETQGKVVGVYSKVGDYRAAGTVLIQVDNELKKASYQSAEINYDKAKKDLERYESLYKEKAVSDSQLEQVRSTFKQTESNYITAKRQYNDAAIKTPISGVVTARNVDIGAYVNNGTVVANVVDISRLKVKVNVAESDVFKLKTGDKVEIETDVYPKVTFEGKIESISSKGDESHIYPVEITLPNSKTNPLRAGMFGRVHFASTASRETIVIPREALIGSVKHAQIFVVENGNVARLKDITVGREAGRNIEVISGLSEGDTIVKNGQNNLKDGYTINVIK